MIKGIKPGQKELARKLKNIKAQNIMVKKFRTIKVNATLADVSHLLIATQLGGLPVVGAKGNMCGIITATDLFLVMDMILSGDIVYTKRTETSNPTVRFAMSTDFVRIQPDASLDRIIRIMKYKNVHTLPVFKGNKLVGIIGKRDVFKTFYDVIKELNR